jgi:hypothetical protein
MLDSLQLDIQPVLVPKASNVLADHLRQQILDGKLVQGTPLPNERDLAIQTQLSRASVREALRILEADGLIATKTGRNGGSEVIRPSMDTVERTIDIFIRGHGIRFQSILEVREAIEPQAGRLAALNHTADDWIELDRAHQLIQKNMHDIPSFLQANLDWHMGVVMAGHNELLIAFSKAIAQPFYVSTDIKGFNSIKVREAVVQAHGKVMKAIQMRDSDAAARRMGRHLGAYVHSVEQRGLK